MKHFKLTNETRTHWGGIILHRIECTVAIPEHNIPVGKKGGWVETIDNLSDNAWVYSKAKVFGNARVSGNAIITGEAQVFENAQVSGNAVVDGESYVFGNAKVTGKEKIRGKAKFNGRFCSNKELIQVVSRIMKYT